MKLLAWGLLAFISALCFVGGMVHNSTNDGIWANHYKLYDDNYAEAKLVYKLQRLGFL